MSGGFDAPRTAPRVVLQFDRYDRRYLPGQALAVQYEVAGVGDDTIRAVEHSVLWYTEGKGEEDLAIHYFDRVTDRTRLQPAVRVSGFATHLPASPLSYEGIIVKIRWCVRVRIFFQTTKDFVSEHVFELGVVPPARMPAPGAS